MSVSSGHFQVIVDVHLQAVQFADCVIQRLFCITEGATSSPGGGRLGRDHESEGGVGGAAGGRDLTECLGAA